MKFPRVYRDKLLQLGAKKRIIPATADASAVVKKLSLALSVRAQQIRAVSDTEEDGEYRILRDTFDAAKTYLQATWANGENPDGTMCSGISLLWRKIQRRGVRIGDPRAAEMVLEEFDPEQLSRVYFKCAFWEEAWPKIATITGLDAQEYSSLFKRVYPCGDALRALEISAGVHPITDEVCMNGHLGRQITLRIDFSRNVRGSNPVSLQDAAIVRECDDPRELIARLNFEEPHRYGELVRELHEIFNLGLTRTEAMLGMPMPARSVALEYFFRPGDSCVRIMCGNQTIAIIFIEEEQLKFSALA